MHTERVSRCNVRRPRSILERFLLVPEPLRSFPLIKNNDCSFEMRSHSWRRRNGIGTGIIIISLLSTFFSFPLLRISWQLGHKWWCTVHRRMFKDVPVTFAIFVLSDLRASGKERWKRMSEQRECTCTSKWPNEIKFNRRKIYENMKGKNAQHRESWNHAKVSVSSFSSLYSSARKVSFSPRTPTPRITNSTYTRAGKCGYSTIYRANFGTMAKNQGRTAGGWETGERKRGWGCTTGYVPSMDGS